MPWKLEADLQACYRRRADVVFIFRFIWANWDVDELLRMKEEITQNPSMLKVGIIGTNAFSFPKLMQRCAESPLPQS